MKRPLLATLGGMAFIICGAVQPALNQETSNGRLHPPVTEFVRGRWFDGQDFVSKTFYSVDGKLTSIRPPAVDQVVDLAKGFVIPPFGDCHNHNFNGTRTIESDVQMYLRDGIFYSMVPGDIRTGAAAVAKDVNTPKSVDVIYAHGVLTGSHSHPATSYEARALGYFGQEQERQHAAEIRASHKLENDAYYVIDTAADLNAKWQRIMNGKPDFIKIILLHSEEYEQRKARTGEGLGIDPKLVPAIVTKAHAAGLRVAAHVDSAFDYHAALTAGVDIMAHLPGYYFRPEDQGRIEKIYALSSDDIKETAARHVIVEPTANWADWEADPRVKAEIREMQTRNLRLLKAAGVTFGIGTDSFGLDALKEAFYLKSLCLFTDRELVRMWAVDTPRIIFPGRKIGYLRDGYEASFLVLNDNPLEHFEAVLRISRRFKQGYELKIGGL